MRFLLDTHCWLWLQTSPERIPADSLEALSSTENDLFLSAASAWEIAIKYALGRLPLPHPPHQYVQSRMVTSGTAPLPIEIRHAVHVASLPAHHRDPFDRLLIAQAKLEELTLLTADAQLSAYDVELWCI